TGRDENAIPQAEYGDATEPVRPASCHVQEHLPAEGEPDAVQVGHDRDALGDQGWQVGVDGRIRRMWTLAVAGQVQLEHVLPAFGEQVDPAGLAPVVFERRGEAVQEYHRARGHQGSLTG